MDLLHTMHLPTRLCCNRHVDNSSRCLGLFGTCTQICLRTCGNNTK